MLDRHTNPTPADLLTEALAMAASLRSGTTGLSLAEVLERFPSADDDAAVYDAELRLAASEAGRIA